MDRNRIIQVIRNLLSNACKFSPEASRIRLEIDRVENQLQCSVIDWGHGIPEGEFGELFTKYTRSSQQDIQGYGLGLSIAYRIIKDHHGQIFAKPNPKGGVIFTFTLPLSD
jgi:signal transduction histidine kinase